MRRISLIVVGVALSSMLAPAGPRAKNRIVV